MYTKAALKVMGEHLEKLIHEQYGSRRAFARAYLERTHRQKTVDEIATRLYKIVRGSQQMQLDDLQVFSELLDVSCEELLWDETMEEDTAEMDNYTVALSEDQEMWERYLQLPERPALYRDSYGRSLIDYAVEFKNLALLHYMLDHGYLHLAMDNEANAGIIGTPGMMDLDVKERNSARYDFWMRQEEVLPELRKDIICLAIECGNLELLEKMHARETPELYSACWYSNRLPTGEEHCDPEIMEALVSAKEEVLQYFAEKFEIEDQQGEKYQFVFPFLGELIERLIERRSDVAVQLLRKAKSHNQSVYSKLCNLKEHAGQIAREAPWNYGTGEYPESNAGPRV